VLAHLPENDGYRLLCTMPFPDRPTTDALRLAGSGSVTA